MDLAVLKFSSHENASFHILGVYGGIQAVGGVVGFGNGLLVSLEDVYSTCVSSR